MLLLSILLFMNVSFFTSPLPHSHYFLTVLLLSSFDETLLSLYHYYIITIIIAEWFIKIATTATTYCAAISMIVIRFNALMEFMLKRRKKTWIKYNLKIFFHSDMQFYWFAKNVSFLYILFQVSSLTKQTQACWKSTYKLILKKTWSQLANVAIIIDIAR